MNKWEKSAREMQDVSRKMWAAVGGVFLGVSVGSGFFARSIGDALWMGFGWATAVAALCGFACLIAAAVSPYDDPATRT